VNAVRIYVATTEGPSEVQRIAEEDPDVRSVVCLNGTSEALPISAAYDAFVRKPTGIIEKLYGHAVFRADVSERISNGKSWQLGLFAAHALLAQGRLAGKKDPAERAFWITGEVSHDLKVGAVDHVAEKLRASDKLFSELIAAGTPITIVLPRGNMADVGKLSFAEHGLGEDVIRLEPADTADDVCRLLGIPSPVPAAAASSLTASPGREPTDSAPRTDRKPLPKGLVFGALVLAVLGLAGAAVWNSGLTGWLAMAEQGQFRQLDAALQDIDNGNSMLDRHMTRLFDAYVESRRPDAGAFDLTLVEQRAPESKSCTIVAFGRIKPVEVEIPSPKPGLLKTSRAEGLCGIAYRLKNAGSEPLHVWFSVVPTGRDVASPRHVPVSGHRTVEAGKAVSVSLNLPRWLRRPLAYRVTAIIGRRDSDDITSWLSQAERETARAWPNFRKRLERTGLSVLSAVHEVKP
jgi:hypothetical protein